MFYFRNSFLFKREIISPCSCSLTEAQKKQIEDSAELIQEECLSENADNSTEEPIEGGLDMDGDGGEMTDGIEEDFDEDGSNELVRNSKLYMNSARDIGCILNQAMYV